jgi:hypothetical protein
MYVRIFAAPFLLIILLSSHIVLLPTQVFAGFCGCGNCWMQYVYPGYCSCGGIYPTCLTDDADPFQFHALTDNHSANTNSIPRGLSSTVAQSDVTDRVMGLMSGGKCFRDKVALSLLGNVRDHLKFVPVHFDEKTTLAFLIGADKDD